jgi:ribosomal-protein-alanine N-acetyltransferase
MDIQNLLTTNRLSLQSLHSIDRAFIYELVNTKEWIAFIGSRDITSEADAMAYIERILNNPNSIYWVVRLQESATAIGMVSYIKRDYLAHHDIGFAFLPQFGKQGYAFEATYAVLRHVVATYNLPHILAATVPSNTNSIQLLIKLGLHFQKEIKINAAALHVYAISAAALTNCSTKK